MKKILAFMLVAVLAFSMAACGGQADENNGGTADANSEVSVTDDEKDDEKAFDTSWTDNEYEALLPQLPFTDWETEMEGSRYKMLRGPLETEPVKDAAGNITGYGKDKAAVIDYLDSLTAYGFTVVETGGIEGYVCQWDVTDTAGNMIEVRCADNYCWIEIMKK